MEVAGNVLCGTFLRFGGGVAELAGSRVASVAEACRFRCAAAAQTLSNVRVGAFDKRVAFLLTCGLLRSRLGREARTAAFEVASRSGRITAEQRLLKLQAGASGLTALAIAHAVFRLLLAVRPQHNFAPIVAESGLRRAIVAMRNVGCQEQKR